ncbi:phage tail protein [Clostridium saccharobutylicum]|uniref:Phage late control protein Gpd n=1 Tax=Clostridium saccharobutylicum TaxID=169679 RepID=A0A1S8NBV5_CLOSA|nr:phage tail protein [Clostridium saccharobutylicum]OOM13966.1 hypothetical protein CLOSAC_20520 [Clostridium saccharobutylicum]
MGQDYVFEYGDIIISPYKFTRINEIKIIRELNQHAKLYISGIISDENIDEYVEKANGDERIEISVKDDKDNIIDLFQGVVTNIGIIARENVRCLKVEALSQTFLMDIEKKSRTFQNEDYTYDDVFKIINSTYNKAQRFDEITNGAKIDKLIVQWKETDWELIKRLASHFNGAVVSECQLTNIKYSLGASGDMKTYELNEFNYSIKKGLQEYNIKSANEDYELIDVDLISYEIITNKILNLYSKVRFRERKLYVYRCEIEMVDGVFSNKYILREKRGMKVRKTYNNKLVGVSLQGRVLDTKKDKVKISLEIDGSPTKKEGIRWFEFATIFSQPNGTGWYCMPEIGDITRLYFPDNVEKHSYLISSMHYQSSDPNKRVDPNRKSIGTKYGKEIVMMPGEVDIIANENLLMRMTDDGGIEINSDKKIILDAKDDIEINGGANIQVKGHSGIKLTQAGASMIIKDDVIINGRKVNVQD